MTVPSVGSARQGARTLSRDLEPSELLQKAKSDADFQFSIAWHAKADTAVLTWLRDHGNDQAARAARVRLAARSVEVLNHSELVDSDSGTPSGGTAACETSPDAGSLVVESRSDADQPEVSHDSLAAAQTNPDAGQTQPPARSTSSVEQARVAPGSVDLPLSGPERSASALPRRQPIEPRRRNRLFIPRATVPAGSADLASPAVLASTAVPADPTPAVRPAPPSATVPARSAIPASPAVLASTAVPADPTPAVRPTPPSATIPASQPTPTADKQPISVSDKQAVDSAPRPTKPLDLPETEATNLRPLWREAVERSAATATTPVRTTRPQPPPLTRRSARAQTEATKSSTRSTSTSSHRKGPSAVSSPSPQKSDRPVQQPLGPVLTSLLVLTILVLVACVVIGALIASGAIAAQTTAAAHLPALITSLRPG